MLIFVKSLFSAVKRTVEVTGIVNTCYNAIFAGFVISYFISSEITYKPMIIVYPHNIYFLLVQR